MVRLNFPSTATLPQSLHVLLADQTPLFLQWAAKFAVDDPLNEFLADDYGVIYSTSHREFHGSLFLFETSTRRRPDLFSLSFVSPEEP